MLYEISKENTIKGCGPEAIQTQKEIRLKKKRTILGTGKRQSPISSIELSSIFSLICSNGFGKSRIAVINQNMS